MKDWNTLSMWHDLLELKEDHEILGLKGSLFLITDFPKNLETGELDYVISQPAFAGTGIGRSFMSFILTDEKIKELFDISDMTLKELEAKMEKEFWENRK